MSEPDDPFSDLLPKDTDTIVDSQEFVQRGDFEHNTDFVVPGNEMGREDETRRVWRHGMYHSGARGCCGRFGHHGLPLMKECGA